MATKKRAATPAKAAAVVDVSPAALLAAVHQRAAAGAMTPAAAQRAAHALGGDPSLVPVPCEAPDCSAVGPLGTRYSIILIYAVTGGGAAGRGPYGCEREQHYGCSHEHAIAAAHACLASHLPHPDTVYPPAQP